MADIDCEFTDLITCPFCGHEDRDSWEVNFETSECAEVSCGMCGKGFTAVQHLEITYSSIKPGEE